MHARAPRTLRAAAEAREARSALLLRALHAAAPRPASHLPREPPRLSAGLHAQRRAPACRALRRARAPGAAIRVLAAAVRPAACSAAAEPLVREAVVVRVAGGMVAVDSLGQDVPLGVRLAFEGGAGGVLLSRINGYGVVLLWPLADATAPPPAPGSRVTVTRAHAVVPHPDALLGGAPRDALADLMSLAEASNAAPGEWPRPARAVMADIPGVPTRTPITQSLHTGVTAVDVLAPIGKGQCMLLVGEPGTGKTALALDAMASQRAAGVKCVYVALSAGASAAAAVSPNTAVVTAPPGAPPGAAFLALCAGFAVAEAWRDAGQDALIVVDDCGATEAFWAACAALVPAPVAGPGASAEEMVEFDGMLVSASAAERRRYFSSFLQRAARLNADHGGGTLTLLALLTSAPGSYTFGAGALAAAQAELSAARRKIAAYHTLSDAQKSKLLAALEAKAAAAAAAESAAAAAQAAAQAGGCAGAVSRPVVEEFMSVSDGQVFLQAPPARAPGSRFDGTWLVSPRDSVSRIGLEAAAPALRAAGSGTARLELAQADDADAFAAGAAGDANVAAARLRAALQQRAGAPVPLSRQVATLLALRSGACDSVPPDKVAATLEALLARASADAAAAAALRDIDATGALTKEARAVMLAAMSR